MELSELNSELRSSVTQSPHRSVLDRLTEPSPLVTDPERRRQARFLATLMMVMLPIGIGTVLIRLSFDPSYMATAQLAILSQIVSLSIYLLSRSRYERLAVWLFIANCFVTLSTAIMINPADPAGYWYLFLVILVSSLLVSLRGTLLVTLLVIAELFLLWTFPPGGVVMVTWMQISFMVLSSTALLLLLHQRQLIEQQRQKQLKEQELRSRRLLERTFDGFAIVQDQQILHASAGFADLLDSTVEGVVGQSLNQLGVMRDAWEGLHSEPATQRSATPIKIKTSTGKVKFVEMITEAYFGANSNLNILGIRDLTAQKKLEESLQHSKRLAAVGHLAAGVAHEINNPLAVMQLRLELLSQLDLPDPVPNHLQVVSKHIERIVRIVTNLRLGTRPQSTQWSTFPLSETVEHVLQTTEHHRKELNIDVVLQPQELLIRADKEQIEQVLVNLLTNAIEASTQGGGIVISAHIVEKQLHLTVTDNGRGIPGEILKDLFKPFTTTKAFAKGSGLGLAIAWGIVQEHGGTLKAENILPHGARFSLTLPQYSQKDASHQA